MKTPYTSVKRLRQRQRALLRQIARVGPFVEGTLVRLPHPTCAHVAWRLTFKVRGKTQAVYIPVDLVEEVQIWHRHYRRLKKLVRQQTKASLAILHRYVAEKRAGRSKLGRRKTT